MYNNKMKLDDTGEIEQVGIVRTGTRHNRGYEYKPVDLTVEQEQYEYNHKIVNALVWIEHYSQPEWEPWFPEEPPSTLELTQ